MVNYSKHIIPESATIRDALNRLNKLGTDLTLFIVDGNGKMTGTLTDGDIRRVLVKKTEIDAPITPVVFRNFRYLRQGQFSTVQMTEIRKKGIYLVPVLAKDGRIARIINLHHQRSLLPIEAVIMAGGDGRRLRPLTEKVPKPLLKVGDKPILEHVIDRLVLYGIENITITVNYLGSLIEDYFGDGSHKSVSIKYIRETEPLGTAGSLALIKKFSGQPILLLNSDLLTTIDYEDFYGEFEKTGVDLLVATLPYTVNLPYAVMEADHEKVTGFKEKPTFIYQANAGIYLMKPEVAGIIPRNGFFNATDLMDALLKKGKKINYYPLYCYWLDIGNHQDFNKAQEDIKHIKQ
ncbi:MAG: nucleotidyltransferase family protein [Bacteroidetes bacterium]|nr:nucleotidyltransferase family protein [Bacteroidota bacterium]